MHLYVHMLQIIHNLSGKGSCAEATHVWVSSMVHMLCLHTGIVFIHGCMLVKVQLDTVVSG